MEKELIVFCFYVNVNGLSRQQVEQSMSKLIEMNENTFDDVNKTVKLFYLPITNGETRMECIYPFNSGQNLEVDIIKLYRLLSNTNKEKFNEILDSIDKKIKGE